MTQTKTFNNPTMGAVRDDGVSVDSGGELSGWRFFAGTMLIIGAMFNIIDGLIGIWDSNYYSSVAAGRGIHLPITDSLATWGWIALVFGVVMMVVSFGIFANSTWAKVLGVLAVGLNMIFHLGFLASFPLWSLTIITLDAFIIYGMTVPTYAERARR